MVCVCGGVCVTTCHAAEAKRKTDEEAAAAAETKATQDGV
jgi:hypothetical protein